MLFFLLYQSQVQTTFPVICFDPQLLLTNESIDYFELDVHMSALEGSINILPRRILVPDSAIVEAENILLDNGIELA